MVTMRVRIALLYERYSYALFYFTKRERSEKMKRIVWMAIVQGHNLIRKNQLNKKRQKKPTIGYYGCYHGYWVSTLNIKQNINKCKNEQKEIANRKK